jgi:aerobic-type carbon monoxide dehydrogenase small subunit (CoxS/CutS family)
LSGAPIQFTLNGQPVACDVAPATRVIDVLRITLRLTGTKESCGVGECGSCAVLLDGVPAPSCLLLAGELSGRAVSTIEATHDPRIEAMRRAFLEEAAFQCGACTPGLILLASRIPHGANDETIRSALAGNLCRCTGYASIVRAVRRAHSQVCAEPSGRAAAAS